MAENLKRLVSNEALRTLQEKLDFWLKEYNEDVMMVWKQSSHAFCLGWRLPLLLLPWENLLTARSPLCRTHLIGRDIKIPVLGIGMCNS
ncbi:SPATA18 isoform 7 [Pongo abelii]|uniref:SPATA18 isoform 7 n=1 Tax=Pongo abelii TaxID=9601 RepID=A0A2J8SGI6_PONAB|nr:SPATA18 isoform 7 [Pongo abelii]